MRNDVSIPPEGSDLIEPRAIAESSAKQVSAEPLPPTEGLKADVTLFDHPNLEPGGAGNFWLLGIIGVFVLGAVLVVAWMLRGLMK